jgi:hypothetical protein
MVKGIEKEERNEVNTTLIQFWGIPGWLSEVIRRLRI